MIALLFTALCLMAGSHSAPLACERLAEPLALPDLQNLFGRWAFVAGSFKDPAAAEAARRRDSTAVYFHNSSVTRVNRVGSRCEHHHQNVSTEGGRHLSNGERLQLLGELPARSLCGLRRVDGGHGVAGLHVDGPLPVEQGTAAGAGRLGRVQSPGGVSGSAATYCHGSVKRALS